MAASPSQPVLECGNKTARPRVRYCAVHVLAWAALRQLPFSGTTSSTHILDSIRPTTRRCCLRRFLPIASPLWLPRLVLSLDPAATLGRHPAWRMEMQCLPLVTALLLGVSSALCTRLPPSASPLASLSLPAWSSFHTTRGCSLCSPVLLCPGATAFACSCFARVHPGAQKRVHDPHAWHSAT